MCFPEAIDPKFVFGYIAFREPNVFETISEFEYLEMCKTLFDNITHDNYHDISSNPNISNRVH